MRLKGTSLHSAILFQENVPVPNLVQILRVGKFNHPVYGAFEITAQTLSEMKANFDNKIRGIDMAFDYYHASDEDASGWVKALELKEDGTELWSEVEWTPKAKQKLMDRELRYFSPDFAFQWTDPETNRTFNNVLFGGGLTNRPFLKEMTAIVADENKTGVKNMTELEKLAQENKTLAAEVKKLSEQVALAMPAPKVPEDKMDPQEPSEIEALKKQLAEVQAQLAQAKGENEVMMAEKQKMEAAKCMAEKKAAFTVLLTEGKACAAQEESYLKGDMEAFIKLAQPLNLKGSGSSTNQNGGDDVATILKLAEEKRKANSKLSQGDAISLAKKELKK